MQFFALSFSKSWHQDSGADDGRRLSLTLFLFFKNIWSSSFKEQSAHVASVKNILESHASYLMSGKELSKLVAFVKGTQFDLVV